MQTYARNTSRVAGLPSGRVKVSSLAGQDETMTPNYTLAAMAVGDEIVSVVRFNTAASIATADVLTPSNFTAGAGVLTRSSGAENNTSDQLLVTWIDRT